MLEKLDATEHGSSRSRLEQFDDLYAAYHTLQAELEALQKKKGLSLDSPEDLRKFFNQQRLDRNRILACQCGTQYVYRSKQEFNWLDLPEMQPIIKRFECPCGQQIVLWGEDTEIIAAVFVGA